MIAPSGLDLKNLGAEEGVEEIVTPGVRFTPRDPWSEFDILVTEIKRIY